MKIVLALLLALMLNTAHRKYRVANLMTQQIENHKKKTGRTFGASTKFPGIIEASRLINRSPGHVRAVLLGQRKSRSLLTLLEQSKHSLSKVAAEILAEAQP